MGEICIRARDRQGDDPPPCVDPWDRAYDEDFARSGIRRFDITVLPPDRFSDDAMPEDRAERLLGRWYARSREAGPRNSVTITGRFGQVCCGWQQPPTAEELYDAIRATNPSKRQRAVFTTWLCECDEWELLDAWADGVYTLQLLVRAMYRHGWENRTDKPVPEQLRTAAGKGENMKARKVALPAPANGIWPAVTALTTELIGACRTLEHNEWYLGGGTMLAADWQHRTSTDIDILIAPGLSMNALPDAAARRIERLIKQEQGRNNSVTRPETECQLPRPRQNRAFRRVARVSSTHRSTRHEIVGRPVEIRPRRQAATSSPESPAEHPCT